MAEDGNQDENKFQLLPSEKKDIEEAEQYAMKCGRDLEIMKQKIGDMGFFKAFFDAKKARNEKRTFSTFFRKSKPEEIQAEIEKVLKFYEEMIVTINKVDDELKTPEERFRPFSVMIDLHEKLTILFDLAHSGIRTTTSRNVSKLYKRFLDKQPELQNQMRKMECVYYRQQLFAERNQRGHGAGNANSVSSSDSEEDDPDDDGFPTGSRNHCNTLYIREIAYQESSQCEPDLIVRTSSQERENRRLRQENENLRDTLHTTNERLQDIEKQLEMILKVHKKGEDV